jgi:hypothetical protein
MDFPSGTLYMIREHRSQCKEIVYGVKTGGNGVARDLKLGYISGMIHIQITSFPPLLKSPRGGNLYFRMARSSRVFKNHGHRVGGSVDDAAGPDENDGGVRYDADLKGGEGDKYHVGARGSDDGGVNVDVDSNDDDIDSRHDIGASEGGDDGVCNGTDQNEDDDGVRSDVGAQCDDGVGDGVGSEEDDSGAGPGVGAQGGGDEHADDGTNPDKGDSDVIRNADTRGSDGGKMGGGANLDEKGGGVMHEGTRGSED